MILVTLLYGLLFIAIFASQVEKQMNIQKLTATQIVNKTRHISTLHLNKQYIQQLLRISNTIRSWPLQHLIIICLYEREFQQKYKKFLLNYLDDYTVIQGVEFVGSNPSQRFIDQFCLMYEVQYYITSSSLRQVKITQYPSYYQLKQIQELNKTDRQALIPSNNKMTISMLFELLQAYITGCITDIDDYQTDDIKFVKQTLRKFFGFEKLTKSQAKCLKSHISQHQYNVTKILNLLKNILELKDVTKKIKHSRRHRRQSRLESINNKIDVLTTKRKALYGKQHHMTNTQHKSQIMIKSQNISTQSKKVTFSQDEIQFDDIQFNEYIRSKQLYRIRKSMKKLRNQKKFEEKFQRQSFAVKKNAVFKIKNEFLNYILNTRFTQNVIFYNSNFRQFTRKNYIQYDQQQLNQQNIEPIDTQLINEMENSLSATAVQSCMQKLIQLTTKQYFSPIIQKYNKSGNGIYGIICYYWKLIKRLSQYLEDEYKDIQQQYRKKAFQYEQRINDSIDAQRKKHIAFQIQRCQMMADILEVIFQQSENYLNTATQVFRRVYQRFCNSPEMDEVKKVLEILCDESKIPYVDLNYSFMKQYIYTSEQNSISNQHEQCQPQQSDESTDEGSDE